MLDLDTTRRWNDWANWRVFEVLKGTDGEPERALAAFQHILETEVTWLRRIVGHPEPNLPLWGEVSMGSCGVWLNESRELIAGLSDADLDRSISYRNSKGDSFTDSVGEVLGHTFLHSSQYRGEAAGLLAAAGHTVPDLDLIFWKRMRAAE
ncbi:MAG: hypothetical protein KC482_01120 [Dehalococcoidia bacterium]|nr:hypothetical protein [Dehalococcoidia bacterium]MCA9852198.1 hypothetical protein [Dehalococcoidia bacterium]